MRGVVIFLILIIFVPLVFSISIKELISRYSFYAVTGQMNVTNFADSMIDKNNNGLNDTLVLEFTTNNAAGNFIFAVNLFDKDGTLTNKTNKTLASGINKINVTFSSLLLTQSQSNYSIKVYNSTHSLKYRKDNILTQNYSSYEEGFRVTGFRDSKINKTLRINITLNSPINGTHRTTLFLSYNNSVIYLKEDKLITNSINHLLFNFDNETLKRTHFVGNFTVSSVKVSRKAIKTNFATSFYDFKDFAVTSYIYNFSDNGTDANKNSKYDFLEINASSQIEKDGNYTIAIALYDLFGNIVEAKNSSYYLNSGKNTITFNFNGSMIYAKKLNGPFAVKSIELFENGTLVDQLKDAYVTSNYDFNDFEQPDLPDLKTGISVSNEYLYGISNITINFTFKNIGSKHAFNIFTEIFDNKTFFQGNKSNILNADSQIKYEFKFTNISDFEISAMADAQDFVEESNESNNAERVAIKLNKRPNLTMAKNITVNETDRIIINLSASDPNEDNLSFSINLSRFSDNYNIFEWNTTTTESGNYTLSANASDGFLSDTVIFQIIVLDVPGIDIDNDGINDSIDKLIGDENSVNSSTINLQIFLDNSKNLSRLFNESRKIKFMDSNFTIAEFDFDFSKQKLNLTKVAIDKQKGSAKGSLIVRGLKMPEGTLKTLYLDKANTTLNGICIKEEEMSSISEISNDCNLNNEFKVECDGTMQNSYSCTYNSTISKYKIKGLKHSGIIQIDYVNTEPSPGSSGSSSTGSSGGGGSGGAICISNWQCSQWSNCIDGFKNRKCSDANQCIFSTSKPVEMEPCVIEQNEENFVNIIKPLDYIDKTIKRLKQGSSSKLAGVTGLAVKSGTNKNFNLGIFIILSEVVVLVGAYLAVKTIFFSKIFK